jgi:site-specific recombinase XerD
MKRHGAETCQAERSNSLKHLSDDELLDVFEAARRRSTRDHALLIVCFQHALRASELISLKLGDIDWGKVVGASGFEPPTSWSRTRRDNQASLRPDKH